MDRKRQLLASSWFQQKIGLNAWRDCRALPSLTEKRLNSAFSECMRKWTTLGAAYSWACGLFVVLLVDGLCSFAIAGGICRMVVVSEDMGRFSPVRWRERRI